MIKASFLATVLFTAALAGNTANAKLLNVSKLTPKVQSGAVKDVYAGIKFHYMDKEDRLTIVNDFLKSVELEYVLLPLKADRIGLNFKALKEAAIEAEMAAPDYNLAASDRKDSAAREKISFLQASSNMEFLDRMQLLVAKFKDTHFSIREKIARPFSYNGYRFFRIQGKIVVGSMDKKFIGMVSALSGTDFSAIQVGSQVVAIDGVDVEQKINELKPYIAGSSDEFIDMEAVRSLTIRNFKYEKKNFTRVTFADGSVFKLPIFVNNSMQSTPRLDAITYFNKYEVPSDASAIGISFDKTTGKWVESGIAFAGYSASQLKTNLKGVTEMMADNGTPAMRTGYFINKGKSYAVLQLLTFSTVNVKVGEQAVHF